MLLLFATASESSVRVLNSREVAIDQETFIEMSRDIEKLEKIEELSFEQKNLIDTLNYKISLLEQEKLLFNDRIDIKDAIISKSELKELEYIKIENEMKAIVAELDTDITKYKFNITANKFKSNFLLATITGIGVSIADDNDEKLLIGGIGLLGILLNNTSLF
jgi:hypothetical protein